MNAKIEKVSKVTEDALKVKAIISFTNSVMCINCERVMTVFNSEKGACPYCASTAVYPFLPGHVVKADVVPDVRRVG